MGSVARGFTFLDSKSLAKVSLTRLPSFFFHGRAQCKRRTRMTNMAVREETRPSWTQKTAANDGIKQSDGVVPSSWDDFTKAALSYEYMLNLDYMGSHLKRKKKVTVK